MWWRGQQDLKTASTANVLISGRVLKKMKAYFNEAMALTGGSDTHFFIRVANQGYKLVWADEAVVHEWLPASRVNARWILKRALRTAQNEIYMDLLTLPPLIARSKRFIHGVGRIGVGAALLVPYAVVGVFKGQQVSIKPIRILYRGVGMVMGAVGKRYDEYKIIHKV
jgi:succinoglycan biosynthesis protein ExoM